MTNNTISHDARSYRLTSIDMLRGLVILQARIDALNPAADLRVRA